MEMEMRCPACSGSDLTEVAEGQFECQECFEVFKKDGEEAK
jgi:ribosomal protein L37AE/L43A